MCTLKEMLERFEVAKEYLPTLTGQAIDENKDMVLDVVRGQLLEGKDGNGNLLSPKYSEDPYFKTPDAAEKYAAWKKRLFPGDRPIDTPNLIIRGDFHNAINLTVSGEHIDYSNNISFAPDVFKKFGDQILGIMPDSRPVVWGFVRAPLVHKIAEMTGTNVR